MQAVIAIPELAGLISEKQATEMLMRPLRAFLFSCELY